MGFGRKISVEAWVDLDEFNDESIIEEVIIRGLEGEVINEEEADITETEEDAKQKMELFKEHRKKLSWEQWNFIFKGVARCDKHQLKRLPKDYSLVLNETIQ